MVLSSLKILNIKVLIKIYQCFCNKTASTVQYLG